MCLTRRFEPYLLLRRRRRRSREVASCADFSIPALISLVSPFPTQFTHGHIRSQCCVHVFLPIPLSISYSASLLPMSFSVGRNELFYPSLSLLYLNTILYILDPSALLSSLASQICSFLSYSLMQLSFHSFSFIKSNCYCWLLQGMERHSNPALVHRHHRRHHQLLRHHRARESSFATK